MRHALKNALIPVVTLVGLQLPILVGGAVIMENIFNLPGLGRLMLLALQDRDYTVVSGVNLLFGTGVLLNNLFIDVVYALLDPRIRYRYGRTAHRRCRFPTEAGQDQTAGSRERRRHRDPGRGGDLLRPHRPLPARRAARHR